MNCDEWNNWSDGRAVWWLELEPMGQLDCWIVVDYGAGPAQCSATMKTSWLLPLASLLFSLIFLFLSSSFFVIHSSLGWVVFSCSGLWAQRANDNQTTQRSKGNQINSNQTTSFIKKDNWGWLKEEERVEWVDQ